MMLLARSICTQSLAVSMAPATSRLLEEPWPTMTFPLTPKRGPLVLRGAVGEVVEALGEALEFGVGELAAELVLKEGGGGATEGLGELEENVADEAVADDDVGLIVRGCRSLPRCRRS